MLEELQQRVNRGIALLDEKRPGWANEIDLSTFDINGIGPVCGCIIHQIYGSYCDGVHTLGLDANNDHLYGFETEFHFFARTEALSKLQTIWVSEITQRQHGSK